MNKDTVAGAVKETGGKIRKNVDRVFGDKTGETLGKKDETEGKVQKNYGKLKDAANDD